MQTQKTEETTTEELRTGLHGGIDRAERAEDEVKRLETLTRKMRNSIDRCIAELYNIPEARTAIRWLERTYAEASDPCLFCETKRVISRLGVEVADLHMALNQAVIFARGCPPDRIDACKGIPEGSRPCPESWATALIERAHEKRGEAIGYVNPLKAENEALRDELREIKTLVRQGITPRYVEAEADE